MESGVKYVKRFLRGKSFASLEHLNESLLKWIVNVADQRIHGTTQRKPAEMFEQERDLLISHIGNALSAPATGNPLVARDCMLRFETNRYSIPFRFVGEKVEVQAWQDRILIFHHNMLIVSHPRREGSYCYQIGKEHYHGIFYQENVPSVSLLHFDHGPLINEEVQVRDLGFYERLLEGGAL